MSCRSRSEAYKLALTDRFTNPPPPGLSDLHNLQIYEPKPLQDPATELRFLHLLPKRYNVNWNEQSVVRCKLTTSSPEHEPDYVGLSYTWGDPQIRRPIVVGETIFHATETLAVALEHLQEQDKTLTLWVDAICIDQKSSHEKSVQVQRMGDIFASASMVIAWLGVSADGSDVALKELGKYEDSDDSRAALEREFRDLSNTDFPVEPFKALLGRQWFKRVWVSQEVALHKEAIFVCGLYDTDRDFLLWSFVTLLKHGVSSADLLTSIAWGRFTYSPRRSLTTIMQQGNLYIQLAAGKGLQCSDPRDFAYGLFGRVIDTEVCGLRVDYSLPVEEVFTEFAEALVRMAGLFSVSCLWHHSTEYGRLPSWVPDSSNTSYWASFDKNCVYKSPETEIFTTNDGNKALKVTARSIGKVESIRYKLYDVNVETSNPNPREVTSMSQHQESEALKFLDLLQQAISQDAKVRETHQAEKITYKMSISSVAFIFLLESHYDPHNDSVYNSYRAFRGLVDPPEDQPDPQIWCQNASRNYLALLKTSLAKYLFITSKGHVGLSRDPVHPGEWVYQIDNIEGPCILREADEGMFRIASVANIFSMQQYKDIDAPEELLSSYDRSFVQCHKFRSSRSFLEHSGFVLRCSFLRKRYHFNEVSKANTIFCWNKHIPSYYHCLPDLKRGPCVERRLVGSLTGFESPVAVSYLRCNPGSHCYIIFGE